MIVAGAGIIGLTCAWRLALCKIPVTVFDAREAGGEASWAGAGMLAPGGEMEKASPLTEMALRSLALYPDFVNALQEASGVPIDYQRCGAMEVAWSAGVAARFYPDDALVNPRDVVRALRVACLGCGVLFHEHEPVLQILPGGSCV